MMQHMQMGKESMAHARTSSLENLNGLSARAGKSAFNVAAFTVGYTRDVELFRNVQSGIGVNVSAYAIDSALKPFYGNRPWGVNVFVRFRLKPTE